MPDDEQYALLALMATLVYSTSRPLGTVRAYTPQRAVEIAARILDAARAHPVYGAKSSEVSV